MSRLKAVKPEARGSQRAKIIISGGAGVGKTYFALDFPSVYYIDVEGSAERNHYAEKLASAGGVYFGIDEGSQSLKEVTEQVIGLATEDHQYKTVVIDSFSKLYAIACFEAEERVGNDYGADKKEANKPTRKLLHWLGRLDMNVILICHPADKWEKGEVTDTTFDGMKKLDHELDLWLEVKKQGKTRKARIRKSRLQGFEDSETMPFSFDEFSERYGSEHISAKRERLHKLATEKQVNELTALTVDAGIGRKTIESWLKRANVETLDLMPADTVKKCIAYCKERTADNGSSNADVF